MDQSIYDDLPDDHEKAFVYLEKKFRAQLEKSLENNDQSSFDAYSKRRYMSSVIAAATSLGIPGIKDHTISYDDRGIWDAFDIFENDVVNISIQIEINHARRKKKYSVALDSVTKQKIRHYIEQIRTAVDASDLSQDKRDAIFKKLNELMLEIDRDRTRFEVVADGIRRIARLSGDVEREGAEPWWKWVKLIFGEIDDAKEKEPSATLPAPAERKQLEAPKKQLPSPKSDGDLDDKIPF